jgi:hypothetical protein
MFLKFRIPVHENAKFREIPGVGEVVDVSHGSAPRPRLPGCEPGCVSKEVGDAGEAVEG